jgi:hypothetical protein
MEEFLSGMIGRALDVYCGGGASLRGEVLKVEGGLLYLKDEEEQLCYIVVEKIVVVWEARESEHRAGFVGGKPSFAPNKVK